MIKERQQIKLTDLVLNNGQLDWLPRNPRQWTKDDLLLLIRSIDQDPDFMDDRPPLITPFNGKYVVFAGNMRTTAEKKRKVLDEIECVVYVPENETDQATIVRRAAKDNGKFGSYDWDILANEWDGLPLTDWGVPAWNTPTEVEEEKKKKRNPNQVRVVFSNADDLEAFKDRYETIISLEFRGVIM